MTNDPGYFCYEFSPMQNRITATLLEADRQAVLEAFTTILTKLPFLVDLSQDERRELPKMGDKSVAFVRKSVEMAQEGADYHKR